MNIIAGLYWPYSEPPPVCLADVVNMTAFNGSYAYFFTPYYPNNYPNNENCQWRTTSTLQVSHNEIRSSAELFCVFFCVFILAEKSVAEPQLHYIIYDSFRWQFIEGCFENL